MKKQIFYLASVAMVAGLAACSNDELENSLGYSLKSNELAASIQDAVSTRTNIEGKDLKWTKDDAISVFDENGSGNYQFTLSQGKDETTGVFQYAGTASFTPTTAFYPYSDKLSNVKNGKIYWTLEKAITYDKDNPKEVKMPMVGSIEDQNIAFTNLTALVKINVVNFPAKNGAATATATDYSRATLISEDGFKIAGPSVISVSDKTLAVTSSSSQASDQIVITNKPNNTEAKYTAGNEYDFYFIVPAGDYPSGLSFGLGTSSASSASDYRIIYTAYKEMQANHIYKKTLRFDDNGALIEDSDLEEWNNELAAGGKTLTADLSDKKGTLFIPTAASTSAGPITLNLTIDGTGSNEVNIAATDPTQPTPQVNIVLTATGETNTNGVLNINLPKSSVTLSAPAAESEADTRTETTYAVTLATVNATTSADVLRIAEGVKVTTLSIAAGNVYIDKDAAATTISTTQTSVTHYVFNATGTSGNGIKYATDAVYGMMFPKDGSRIEVSKETELEGTVTIDNGKTVTLNLTGPLYVPAGGAEAIIVKGGSTLNITGTTAGSLNSIKTLGNSTNATILVEGSSKVTLENATIANAGGVAVQVKDANSQFSTTTGTITGKANSDAIQVSDGGEVIINKSDAAITGDVTVDDAKATLTVASLGKLTVKGDGTNLTTVTATTVGGVDVQGGKAVVKATTLGETVAVSAGEAEITADNTTPSTTNLNVTATGKLTLKGGKISGKAEVAGTDATHVGTFVVEDGTISYGTTGAATITGTDHSVIEIKGGTIENTTGTAATDVALSLASTNGIAKATISGENTKLSSNVAAIVVTGVSSNTDAAKTPVLVVKNGTIVSSNSSNGAIEDATGPASISIEGGTIKNVTVSADKESVQGTGIKQTQAGSLAITGGTVQAETAVYVTAGNLTVTGTKEVNILATSKAITAAGNTVTLSNENATYSVNSDTATKYSFEGSAAITTLSIEAGSFNGNIKAADGNTHFISGGTFTNCDGLRTSENQIKYLQQGRKLQWNEEKGYYTVVVE
jgi:hypothetical protein